MNRLAYRIVGNALTGFATGYVIGFTLGISTVEAGVVGGLLQAVLATGKELYEFGTYKNPEELRKKPTKLNSILLF